MATKKWQTDLVNHRDFILSNLSKEVFDLISEESKEHIFHIINKLVYNKKNMNEFLLQFQVYLAALNNLYANNSLGEKIIRIEENLDSLCRECILYAKPVTSEELKSYSDLNKKQLKEVKTLQTCLSEKLSGTVFSDNIDRFNAELKKFELSLGQDQKEILLIKSYFKAKGTKPDLSKFSFAKELSDQFTKDLKKCSSFKLDSRYARFFTYNSRDTSSKDNTLKASNLNLTALALNLIGHRTTEKQLYDGLNQYAKFRVKDAPTTTMKELASPSYWDKRAKHEAGKASLIAALKKHGLRIRLSK